MNRISEFGFRILCWSSTPGLIAGNQNLRRNDKTEFPNPKSLTPVLHEQLPLPSYLRGVPGKTGDESTPRQSIQ